MKKFILFFFSFLILQFCPFSAGAQVYENSEKGIMDKSVEERDQEGTQQSLMNVLKHAREKNYLKLANMMVYSGKDPNRQLKTMINYDDPHERLEVEHTANKLNFLMRKAKSYEPKNFRKLEGMGFVLFYYDLIFTDKKGKAKIYKVSFVKRNGNYYLAKME